MHIYVMGVMKMGIIVATAGKESTFLGILKLTTSLNGPFNVDANVGRFREVLLYMCLCYISTYMFKPCLLQCVCVSVRMTLAS